MVGHASHFPRLCQEPSQRHLRTNLRPVSSRDQPQIGAEGRTRTGTDHSTRPSTVRVYQFRHFGSAEGILVILPLKGKPLFAWIDRFPVFGGGFDGGITRRRGIGIIPGLSCRFVTRRRGQARLDGLLARLGDR